MSDSPHTPFRGIAPLARAYIVALSLCAPMLALALTALDVGPALDPAALAICVLAGAAANLFEIFAPGHYAFQPSLVFFFWGAVLLPPWAIVVLAIACSLPSIVLRRLPWYKTLFNIAMHALPGLAAHLVAWWGEALPMAAAGGLRTVGVLVAAAIAFVALNYLLLVLVIAATAGIAPTRAFGSVAEGIPLDIGLAITGAALAALWSASPALATLAAGPMGLIYHALRVPMLTHQVETDPKTGLFNLPYLRQRLREALEAARRTDLPVTVVMLDNPSLAVCAGCVAAPRCWWWEPLPRLASYRPRRRQKAPQEPKRMTAEARLAAIGSDEQAEVIVQFGSQVSRKQGQALVTRFHGDVVRELPIINAFGVMLDGRDMRKLRRHPKVRALSPNADTKPTGVYNTITNPST